MPVVSLLGLPWVCAGSCCSLPSSRHGSSVPEWSSSGRSGVSFLSHPPPKESLAWEQPTCTFGVTATFQQLKSFVMENPALLLSLLLWAPRVPYLSRLQRGSLWCGCLHTSLQCQRVAGGCLGSLSPTATYKEPALLKIGLGITENPLQNPFVSSNSCVWISG